LPRVKSATSISACTRCGTCCKKGGPSFHHEDKPLIEKGIILLKYLYTIRAGELAHDNVKGGIRPVPSDIIKIKGPKGSWTCIFFDERKNICKIYENRPLECRVLTCWHTREIEEMYSKNRLTRKDLTASIAGLWDLIEDHQGRCSYEKVQKFVNALDSGKNNDALNGISAMLRYDSDLRRLVVQKGGLDSEITDFLFGRPLMQTLRMYGLKVKKQGNTYRLFPVKD